MSITKDSVKKTIKSDNNTKKTTCDSDGYSDQS